MSDRRESPREPVPGSAIVRVKFQNRRQLKQTWLKDISKGGIFLRTPAPLDPGEDVVVVLELPNGEEIELGATVVHSVKPEESPTGPGMGMKFIDLTPEKRARVEAFLQRHRTVVPTAGAPPALEQVVQCLRRALWLACDPQAIGASDYYQLLGLSSDAPMDLVRERIAVLRVLLDPASPPEGVARFDPARLSGLALALLEIEGTLTDPQRRADYDAVRNLVLR